MNEDQKILAEFGGVARLFPLPNLVFFPRVVQGLHIFETRYRELMADALAGDQLIALVLLRPEWEEDYDGSPAIENVGCLGSIIWHEKMPDGRYNLRLRGLSRINIVEELETGRGFRSARAELVPDLSVQDPSRSMELRRRLAETLLPRFENASPARQQLEELIRGELPLGNVCDILAYALPLPLHLKQALLAEPNAEIRAELIARSVAATADATGRRFPPAFSEN